MMTDQEISAMMDLTQNELFESIHQSQQLINRGHTPEVYTECAFKEAWFILTDYRKVFRNVSGNNDK